ncbi:MAG: succinylglutamate desuccinylase/aspartoacylase family protein [Neptuniibacter sp.]
MKKLFNPQPNLFEENPEDFIRNLSEPVMIFKEGVNKTRTRGIVTLLHGNEPSGLRAVHKWLKSGVQPLCNIVCFIPSIPAAIIDPIFKYRVFPGQRDMNRCFLPPYNDEPGKRAEEILQIFSEYQPECIIDVHNTSGHSPDFGVVTFEDSAHEALVSLFTDRMIVTDLRLGALMETSTSKCPVVTIECGGAEDQSADEVAFRGLDKYLHQDNVLQLEHGHHLDLYRHPVRLELAPDCVVAYSDSYILGTDLTVLSGVDKFNFGEVERGELIGWLGNKKGRDCVSVKDSQGFDVFDKYFEVKGNQLLTAQPLKLFMITTRPDIAIGDCLLYATAESEHDILDT